jgi:hypothetical protein
VGKVAGLQGDERMSIFDGFNLWLGKQLAEVAIVAGIFAFLGLLFCALVVAARIERFIRRHVARKR